MDGLSGPISCLRRQEPEVSCTPLKITSLEDRYGAARLDLLIRMHWSRASDDPLLTVSALGSSRHLARVWPGLWMQTVGTLLLAVNGAVGRMCGWLLRTTIARVGCCTWLLYGSVVGSENGYALQDGSGR